MKETKIPSLWQHIAAELSVLFRKIGAATVRERTRGGHRLLTRAALFGQAYSFYGRAASRPWAVYPRL